jgi:hypothetical protein
MVDPIGGLSEIARRKVRKIIDELLNGQAPQETLPSSNFDVTYNEPQVS